MQITVYRDGSAPAIYSLKGALRLLPLSNKDAPLLARLLNAECAQVTLTDGTTAYMMLTEFAPPGEQPLLPWDANPTSLFSPERGFVATCTLNFPLEARITLRATDRLHAEELIDRVLCGERQPPSHFRVIITQEHLWRLSNELQQLGLPGHVPGIVDYALDDLNEQKTIEFQPIAQEPAP